jgi:hypothetical protein
MFALLALMTTSLAQTQPAPVANPPSPALSGFGLDDGTPVKLRISETISSASAHVGDEVPFEVLEEVKIGNTVVIAKGATAIASVTNAQGKRSMGRAGKLDINIDYVKMVDGEKAALRAVQDLKGGGHQGAVTGAMVATSIVFFPAAPLFLFVHGKDISIPKGTEITGFVNGNTPLELAKFQAEGQSASTSATTSTEVDITSTPTGADINVDDKFVGNTPSTITVASGQHVISIRMAGYQNWERTLSTSGGTVKLNAILAGTNGNGPTADDAVSTCSVSGDCSQSLADAARAMKAKTNQASPSN